MTTALIYFLYSLIFTSIGTYHITSPFLVLSALKTLNDLFISFVLILSSFISCLLILVWVHPKSTSVCSHNFFPFDILMFVYMFISLFLLFLWHIGFENYYLQRSFVLCLLWTFAKTLLFIILLIICFFLNTAILHLLSWSIVFGNVAHFVVLLTLSSISLFLQLLVFLHHMFVYVTIKTSRFSVFIKII